MGVEHELGPAGFAGQLALDISNLIAKLRERRKEIDEQIAEFQVDTAVGARRLESLRGEDERLKIILLDTTQRLLALKLELENKEAKLRAKE